MSKKVTDENKPIGRMHRVHDFLPPPDKLVMPEETVKVTISLSKSSVRFFKQQASKYHMKYQKMIRNLLDSYTAYYMNH